jgi:hypothetical protein
VVIFSKSKVTQNTRVMSDNKELDICESHNYLGILFNVNNNVLNAKKKLIEQAQNALYSVYYKIRNKKIPLNLQLNHVLQYSEKIFKIVCIPLTFSDIRTVSSAYNKINILRSISSTSKLTSLIISNDSTQLSSKYC